MFWRQCTWPFLWAAIIVVFSLLPAKELDHLGIDHLFSYDKLGHLLMYTLQVFFLAVGFRKQYQFLQLRYHHLMFAFAAGNSLGIAMEIVQALFIPGRMASVYDLLANILGAMLGLLLFLVVYGRSPYADVTSRN